MLENKKFFFVLLIPWTDRGAAACRGLLRKEPGVDEGWALKGPI